MFTCHCCGTLRHESGARVCVGHLYVPRMFALLKQHVYSLTGLEVRSLKFISPGSNSGCRQGWLLQRLWGRIYFLAFFEASSNHPCFLECGHFFNLLTAYSHFLLPHPITSSSGVQSPSYNNVSGSLGPTWMIQDNLPFQGLYLKSHLQSLLPYKVTFPGSPD